MSNVQNPAVAGKETDPSVNPLIEILAAIREIGTRLDILEQRFEYLDRNCLEAIRSASLPVPKHLIEEEQAPNTVPDPMPALALRSDGAVLLSPEYLDEASREGRAVWTGVVLSYAEACDALDALNGAACDAGAHIGGRLIALARKKGEPEGSGGDGDE
jgi:hypothetical protein